VWLGSVRPKAPLGVTALVKLSCNAFQAEILEVTMIQLRIAAVAALIRSMKRSGGKPNKTIGRAEYWFRTAGTE
jgi:hypothetical protein